MIHKLKAIKYSQLKQLLQYPKALRRTIITLTSLNIVNAVFSVASAYIVKVLVDYATQQQLAALVGALVLTALVFIAEIVIMNAIQYFNAIQITKEHAKLQKTIVTQIFDKTWLALQPYHTGDLLTLINNDTNKIINFWLNIFPNALALLVHFVLAFTLLFRFDPFLAAVSFIIAPLFLLLGYPISQKLKKYQKHLQEAESALQSYITENIQNIQLIKIFSHTQESLHQLSLKQEHVIQSTRKKTLLSMASYGILIFGYTLGHFSGLAFGAFRLSTGFITFGTFSALLNLIAQVQGPLDGLGRSIPQFIVSLASSERLGTLMDLESETLSTSSDTEQPLIDDFDAITFNQITFGYTQETTLFKDFDFQIRRGDHIAIIGPSGSGKTSLSRLLLSFVAPQQGTIYITKKDLTEVPLTAMSRGLFAYVPQDNVLFSGTILDNLLIANPKASTEELEKALKASCAKDFIEKLPLGLNTQIAERGVGLSEGQIQRICIARALLYHKPILILDEATSALDEHTESQIVENLKVEYGQLTLLAITHRPSIQGICSREIAF